MNSLLLFHICAGSAALIAGAWAMSAPKGGRMHARAGPIFFLAMLAMAGTGAVVALFLPDRGTATIGVFTCYLVATSWVAAKRRTAMAGGGAGRARGGGG